MRKKASRYLKKCRCTLLNRQIGKCFSSRSVSTRSDCFVYRIENIFDIIERSLISNRISRVILSGNRNNLLYPTYAFATPVFAHCSSIDTLCYQMKMYCLFVWNDCHDRTRNPEHANRCFLTASPVDFKTIEGSLDNCKRRRFAATR